jgi:hypothetical protein
MHTVHRAVVVPRTAERTVPGEHTCAQGPSPYRLPHARDKESTGGIMGLAIGVGVLADLLQNDREGADGMRQRITELNHVLEKNNLRPHQEPEKVPAFRTRSVRSYPYSFLHYLRRGYACVVDKAPVRTGDYTDDDDVFVADVTVSLMDSHLLSHSDCEGYYVPQSFSDPLCDDALPGGFAGSCQQLLRELARLAPALGIRLEEGRLAPGEADRLADIDEAKDALWREKIVWFSLFEAATFSVKHRTLLVFH